jgi:tetratricopeptide (TPR) repeat protein
MSDRGDFLALYERGAYREAYAALRYAMATQPQVGNVGDVHVLCASLELIINDDISKAREFLDSAIQLGCQDMASYYRARGHVLWRAGERERGISDLEKSVTLDSDVVNLMALGIVLAWEGDERAAEIWTQVVKQDTRNCRAHIYLGLLAAKTGDRNKGLLLARQAEELDPTTEEREEIAMLYSEMGEFQIALDKYLEVDVLGGEPKGPLYAGIAACHFELGHIPQGCTYIERARQSNPDSTSVKKTWDLYKDRCGY